jgi:general stress protein CsbA
MESFLLSVHVVAGILFVGPVAVTTSLFPRYAPVIGAAGGAERHDRSLETAQLLHRITRVYGALAIVVPIVGLTLAAVQGRTTEIWVVVAMVLTAIAGGLLALQIAPRQSEALASPDDGTQLRRMGMLVGVFNLLWAAVVVLMVVRPGSSSA